jgi:K+-transporting ATPase ATPase B chain
MYAIRKPEPSTRMEAVPESQPPPDRMAQETVFIPTTGSEEELAHAAYLATLADPTRTGKILSRAAHQKVGPVSLPESYDLVSASPINDLSGINLRGGMLREGSLESVEKWIRKLGGHVHCHVRKLVSQIAERGDRAIVIASEKIILGVVVLKIVKPL